MFDNLKGMGALAGLMKDLPRIKAKMEEVKQQLAEVRPVKAVCHLSGPADSRFSIHSQLAGC